MLGVNETSSDIPSILTEEYSPSIPEKFPKSLIPSKFSVTLLYCIFFQKIIEEICEVELLRLYKCTLYYGIQMYCHEEYETLKNCKRNRV